jgi:hypothetical protein
MKKQTLFLSILFLSISLFSCNKDKKHDRKDGHQKHEKSMKMLRHAVLFKFKDGTKPEDIKKVEEAFRALPSKIKEIQGFEFGTNNSPENLNQGFTHLFFLTFKSETDRAIYLPHPDHKAFGAVLTPYLDKVLVLDYWTEN